VRRMPRSCQITVCEQSAKGGAAEERTRPGRRPDPRRSGTPHERPIHRARHCLNSRCAYSKGDCEVEAIVWLSTDHAYPEHRVTITVTQAGSHGGAQPRVRHELRRPGPDPTRSYPPSERHHRAVPDAHPGRPNAPAGSVSSLYDVRTQRHARQTRTGTTPQGATVWRAGSSERPDDERRPETA
jgi:hypothetical protein